MKKNFIAASILILIFITSCGPVNRFTRAKKIPREYALNYRGTEIKAPKSDVNKNPWIVFSDREKNQSFNKPGGKVKAKDVTYLEAFLVIGKRGEYLKLIKHTPDILKNKKLQYKEAEYYGWVHKSKLLLTQQSYTDITTGKKNKNLIAFSDTLQLKDADKFFSQGKVKTFKDLEFSTTGKEVEPFSVVYRLKHSEDKALTLISNKAYIKAEDIDETTLGWISTSMLQNVGTGLHVNYSNFIQDSLSFHLRQTGATINIGKPEEFERENIAAQYKTTKYSPVSSYSRNANEVSYRTGIALPIFDKTESSVFNVNGGSISYHAFDEIARNLRKVNISFVFEGKEKTIEQFPQIVNALQNLQSLFENTSDSFSYSFNTVLTFSDKLQGTQKQLIEKGFTKDYAEIMNFLSDMANNKEELLQMKPSGKWTGLRKAVHSFSTHKEETNLIILIGEKGFSNTGVDDQLKKSLLDNNCRLLGFQVYAGEDNSYNNFVLDIGSMIDYYANEMLKTKGEILVSPKQVKRENHYTAIDGVKNSYRLDFPDNSITQGYILFPSKGETLPMDILTNAVDSIVQQVKTDNIEVITSMSKAFNQVGGNRVKYDSLFKASYGLKTKSVPSRQTLNSFMNHNPGWYLPTEIITLNDSINRSIDYRLLLSEQEMTELKEFITDLSSLEADYKYQAKRKKKADRKPCNCPDDDLFLRLEGQKSQKKASSFKYANTRKLRRHIFKHHMAEIGYCKLCKEKKRHLKRESLAELQRRVTGVPSYNEVLNAIISKKIKRKRKVSDKMLDDLVNYYKSKIEDLDKAEKFESNEEIYYWVEQQHLP